MKNNSLDRCLLNLFECLSEIVGAVESESCLYLLVCGV